MARIAVYIEHCPDGSVDAHAPDYWGCHLRASSREEALDRLTDSIADYIEWCRFEHIPLSAGRGKRTLNIVQVLESPTSGVVGTLFDWDRQPLTDSDRSVALSVLRALHENLVALVKDLHPRVRAWCPADGQLSVSDVLRDCATRFGSVASDLGVGLSSDRDDDALDACRRTHAAVTKALVSATPDARYLLRLLCEFDRDRFDAARRIIRAYQAAPGGTRS